MSLPQNLEIPIFAVVGHPNKGKSSIVAALTRQDKVAISELSGTTTQAQEFPLTINGEIQYALVDTPGFQRPRQMLDLINEGKPNASERLRAIRQFIADHKAEAEKSGRYLDEIELLTPILDGANIIYVVDGSVPYSPEYEAEMTILQWTGQPRMALINPIEGEDFIEEWRQALDQYFSLVRVYNPMTANREQQYAVLSAFEELAPNWKDSLAVIRNNISEHASKQKFQAVHAISDYIQRCLAYSFGVPMPLEALQDQTEKALQKTYEKQLKEYESELKNNLKVIYAHEQLQTHTDQLMINIPDLFDQGNWYIFGLSRQKLIALAASGGAAAGVAIDIGLGGASLLLGSLIGGISSAAASMYFTESPEKIKIKSLPLGGKKLLVGPVKNLQFAFVLLGRAINFQQAISGHSHANRDVLVVGDGQHWLEKLDKKQQIRLTHLLQKGHKGLSRSDQNRLFELLAILIKGDPA